MYIYIYIWGCPFCFLSQTGPFFYRVPIFVGRWVLTMVDAFCYELILVAFLWLLTFALRFLLFFLFLFLFCFLSFFRLLLFTTCCPHRSVLLALVHCLRQHFGPALPTTKNVDWPCTTLPTTKNVEGHHTLALPCPANHYMRLATRPTKPPTKTWTKTSTKPPTKTQTQTPTKTQTKTML